MPKIKPWDQYRVHWWGYDDISVVPKAKRKVKK